MALRFILRFLFIALLSALPVSGPHGRGQVLPHDAYIWQRQWTGELAAAITRSSNDIGAWHVLAAEADAKGRLRTVAIDWDVLIGSGRPVILVFRIDGQLSPSEDEGLLRQVGTAVARLDRKPVIGVEIDHDCATAKLLAYGEFLKKLRVGLDERLRLFITALPAWLASRDLDGVLAQTDEAILQLHAVEAPQTGLFNPDHALSWMHALAQRTRRPFSVALPAYGSRVIWGEDGSILAVESEAPTLVNGYRARELIAAPREISEFLRTIERKNLAQLQGVVWFRLPMATDRRAWSLATWRAVMQGEPLDTTIEAVAENAGQSGLVNVVLRNAGTIDAEVPRRILLPKNCVFADGINGYHLSQSGAMPILQRSDRWLLHSGKRQVIGWTRCAAEGDIFRVDP